MELECAAAETAPDVPLRLLVTAAAMECLLARVVALDQRVEYDVRIAGVRWHLGRERSIERLSSVGHHVITFQLRRR